MKTYTKESLISELLKIKDMGWIENRRHGNDGGVGNTLEDLLDIEENNLPIPECCGMGVENTAIYNHFSQHNLSHGTKSKSPSFCSPDIFVKLWMET